MPDELETKDEHFDNISKKKKQKKNTHEKTIFVGET